MQGAVTGPRRPSSIETQPAAMLGMNAVTSVGGMRPLGASCAAFGEARDAALGGRDRGADAADLERDVEPGVGLGHAGGGDRELREPVGPVQRLAVEPVARHELVGLAGDPYGVPFGGERGDRPAAAGSLRAGAPRWPSRSPPSGVTAPSPVTTTRRS